jgi:hypothetical protein
MPLSPPPLAREPLHTRRIDCRGYRRADGLWDIEGHLSDVKSYGFTTDERGRIEAGEPIHDMGLRLTVDDGLVIRAVEAVTDRGPYRVCPAITVNFQRLVGLAIRPGFTRRVKELLGGAQGCTHLVELIGPVATTAFQTIAPMRVWQEGRESGKKPRLIDSCHAYASDGEQVRQQWPEFYTGAPPSPPSAGEA